MDDPTLTDAIASATLGVDTLWGGNVLSASGTGRFIADCWFSHEPLPLAYTHLSAARVRDSGGVAATAPDARLIDEYLCAVDIPAAIAGIRRGARDLNGTLRAK